MYKIAIVLLLGALTIGAYLSARAIPDQLWADERITLERATSSLPALIQGTATDDVHPPLYYLTLHGWFRLFPNSLVSARIMSILFYGLACAAVSLWAVRLFDDRTAFITTIIYSTSALALWSAQNARGYSMLMLVCVLSSWAYFAIFFQNNKSRWLRVAFISIQAVGFFVHFWFGFLVAAQGLTLIIYRRRWLHFGLFSAIAFLPFALLWLPYLPTQLHTSATSGTGLTWLARPGLYEVAQTIAAYCGYGFLVVAGLSAWRMVRCRRVRAEGSNDFDKLCVLLLLVSLTIPFLISQFKPIFFARYTVIGLQFFALPMGHLLTRLLLLRSDAREDDDKNEGSNTRMAHSSLSAVVGLDQS